MDVRPSNLLVGFLLFSLFFIGMTTVFNDVSSGYNLDPDMSSDYGDTLRHDIQGRAESMTQGFDQSITGIDILDVPLQITGAIIQSVITLGEMPTIVTNTVTYVSNETNVVPDWLPSIIVAIASVIIVVGIVNTVHGKHKI